MIIPLRTDSPLRSTPWVNWGLIAVNTLVFMLTANHPQAVAPYELNSARPLLFQYFTYAFLHASTQHLFFNMLFLYVFGNNVNDRMGNLGYLGFYLAGGVFAGIAYVLGEHGNVLGASGAVAAVTGAYLVLLTRSHITFVYLLGFIGATELPSLWLILGFFVYQDLLTPMLSGSLHAGNVAHLAHIGGTVFGISICMLLLAVHLLPRNQFDVLALIQRWNRRRQYLDLVRSGYDPFGYVPPKRAVVDPNQERIQDIRAQITDAVAHHQLDEAVRLYLQLLSLDNRQVLARQTQLDIANQLYATGNHAAAARSYELFLETYPKYENLEHVQLMLGILYARYLGRYDAAREQLKRSLERLHSDRERALAQEELKRIGPVQTTAQTTVQTTDPTTPAQPSEPGSPPGQPPSQPPPPPDIGLTPN